MGKQTLKRKVVITLKGRDPGDLLSLFQYVEAAFRPSDVEIVVGEEVGPPTLADEPLETRAREHVADLLDRNDAERSGAASVEPEPAPKALTRPGEALGAALRIQRRVSGLT